MRRSALVFLLLISATCSSSWGAPAPSSPSTIVFITSTSDLTADYRFLESFKSCWTEREPMALILPYPLSPYAFKMTRKADELGVAAIAERLGGKAPSLIVAQGNPAFSLALRLRDAGFPGSPIVVFDIPGGEERRKRCEGEKSLYVVELPDIGEKNIEFAARLFPKRKRAVLLFSAGMEPRAAKAANDKFSALFPGLSFVTLPAPSQASADPVLREAPEDTFVIGFTPGWIDGAGQFRFGKDFVRSISDTYRVPVFEYLRSNLDGGTVGGVGMSPSLWGREAAERGLSIVLDKKEPGHWVASDQFANAFADYRELRRFGSSPALLPPGSELINQPPPAWVRYQRVLEPLLAILVLTVAVFILKSVFRRREKRLLLEANARLEREVAERTEELRSSNVELGISNANLIEAVRSTERMQENVLRSVRAITLGRFAAGMANGLNSPLNAVRTANTALKSVIGGVEGGFAARLFAFDERQRAIFLRYAPRVLSRSDYVEETAKAAPYELEQRLSRLSAADAARVASDLSDAGLEGLDEDELAAFADERGSAVAQALFRLSALDRTSWIIDESVDRAAEIIKTLREYVNDGDAERKEGDVDLRGSIERALLIFKNRLPASVSLETSYDEVPSIRGSDSVFVRIWANLVQNALQAMPHGGRLDVSLRREGGYAVVSVGDEGEGVHPSVAERIFEPFVTTRDKAEGMGLGLAFCKKAIESAGGEIGFAGKKRGTVFRVTIPLGGYA